MKIQTATTLFLPLIDVELNGWLVCTELRREDRTNWGESKNMTDLHKTVLEDIRRCWQWVIQTETSCGDTKSIKCIMYHFFLICNRSKKGLIIVCSYTMSENAYASNSSSKRPKLKLVLIWLNKPPSLWAVHISPANVATLQMYKVIMSQRSAFQPTKPTQILLSGLSFPSNPQDCALNTRTNIMWVLNNPLELFIPPACNTMAL